METVENQSTEVEQDTATAPTDTSQEAPDTSETVLSDQPGEQTKSLPFSSGGKEKFKVNGQEFEWDWEETRKYAQLGRSGQLALQRAAETQKKSKEFYGRLLEAAKNDPQTLIRTLLGNPDWRFSSGGTPGQSPDQADESQDPRDLKIRELEQKLSSVDEIKQKFESQEIAEERRAIETELTTAADKFPILKGDKIALNYVKSQYRAALMRGEETSIEDVAFYVAQEIKESRQKQTEEQKKRLEEKRKQAPVTTSPAGSSGSKPMTREDVMRLAGKQM